MTENLEQSQSNDIDIVALVRLALHKWYVFAIAVCVCCAVAVAYYLTAAPQYKTSASVTMRTGDANNLINNLSIGGFSAVDFMGGSRNMYSEIESMRSRKIIRQVIEDLDLRITTKRKVGWREIDQYGRTPLKMTCPANFTDRMRGTLKVKVRKDRDGLYHLKFTHKIENSRTRYKCETADLSAVETPWGAFSFTEYPENILIPKEDDGTYTVYFKLGSLKSRIDQLRETITIEEASKKSDVIVISYTSDNPYKNEKIISKMVEFYNIGEMDDKNKVQSETALFLAERLAEVEDSLHTIERKIENYKKSNNIADIGAQAQITLATSNEYDKRIAATDIQYNLVSFVEDYLRNAQDTDLIPSNTGIDDPSLGEMMAGYNELVLKYLRMSRATNATNPIVGQTLERIRLMRQNILQTIANVKESLTITKRDLQAKNRKFADQISHVPMQERQYLELMRDREIMQTLYVSVLQKRELALLQEASTIDAVRTIDPAYTQETPVAPKLKILLVVAFVLGCILAAGYLYLYRLLCRKGAEPTE